MTPEALAEMNWLAVVVGAVAYFALGALWYSPLLFSRPWQRSIGWDESREAPQMSPTTYAVPLVLNLLSATATAWLAAALGSDTIGEGVLLGLVVGVGYAIAIVASDAVFDPHKTRPWVWFGITGAYHVVGLLIVAVIVSVWQ